MRTRIFMGALGLATMFQVIGCSGSAYIYRALTDNCNCEEYTVADSQHRIEYRLRAQYTMDERIVTTIWVEFLNKSADTLFLDPGMVKISSRNISYQYNDKFIPLPTLVIPPSSSDEIRMTGSDNAPGVNWNKIAGEQLSVTLKSIRLGKATLPQRTVIFVPINPKLQAIP